jgi:hypothetical protein
MFSFQGDLLSPAINPTVCEPADQHRAVIDLLRISTPRCLKFE